MHKNKKVFLCMRQLVSNFSGQLTNHKTSVFNTFSWHMTAINPLFFCKSKTLNSQYLGPKTVMNMCTSHGEDSGTVFCYYIDQSLSTDTNSSFHYIMH